jgi:hypothetical protein
MSIYHVSVPAFVRTLTSLAAILDKAEAHATARKIDPEALLSARLFPDMFPLKRQVQTAADFAAKTCARLTGSDVPAYPDVETSFAELKQRVAKVLDYVQTFKPAQFDGADLKEITVPVGAQQTKTFTGQDYFAQFALPNFYFHAVTAYDILRHNGVEIGKRDFLGPA